MSECSIGSNPTIDGDLGALRLHIHHYRSALNEKGIWLFLATLGCWSVNNTHMQILAFLTTFILFSTQLTESQKEKRTVPSLVEVVKDRITKDDLDNETRNKLLFDLKALQDDLLSFRTTTLLDGLPFLLPWIFFAFSFIVFFGRRLAILAS